MGRPFATRLAGIGGHRAGSSDIVLRDLRGMRLLAELKTQDGAGCVSLIWLVAILSKTRAGRSLLSVRSGLAM
jgi:hypothetical protein